MSWNLKLSKVMMLMTMAIASVFPSAYAQAQGNPDVTDRFLEQLKTEITLDLNNLADHSKFILECANDSSCSYFNFLKEKYAEYRIYIGLYSYDRLLSNIEASGEGYATYGYARVRFTNDYRENSDDLDLLKKYINEDNTETEKQLQRYLRADSKINGYDVRKMITESRNEHYKAIVANMLSNFPFFGKVDAKELTRENLAEAATEQGIEFEDTIPIVQKLTGDDRNILIGFAGAVQRVYGKMPAENYNDILAHFREVNRQKTVIEKLKATFSSRNTYIGIGCGLGGAISAMTGHVEVTAAIAVTCFSYGFYFFTKNLIKTTVDLSRQLQFANTNVYSPDVVKEAVKSATLTYVMSTLILPVLPVMGSKIVTVRDIIMSGNHVFKSSMRDVFAGITAKKVLVETGNTVKGTLKGMTKDMSRDAAIQKAFFDDGKIGNTVKLLVDSFAKRAGAISGRQVKVLLFADLGAATAI